MNQRMTERNLINALQTQGLRLTRPDQRHVSRRGGAGPTDHQAVTIGDSTVMVPVFTEPAMQSPFVLDGQGGTTLMQETPEGLIPLADVSFASDPAFYSRTTADGIPYQQIATLHGKDVLATTVLQTCIRYQSRKKTCQFCSIGQSLSAGRTIERKSPAQLAEVAKVAVELDGVKHMVMTTGTPGTSDRGAAILCESVEAVKAAVDIPIQVQCEPPDNDAWFTRLKEAGADALGMHLEAVTETVRQRVMPGKARVSVREYMRAFKVAVEVFGRGQVSTYILAGLGDSQEDILAVCDELIALGVYPFVVPFVPVRGTPLEDHTPPTAEFMDSILRPLSARLRSAGLLAADIKAGCGRCGACSSLASYEKEAPADAH
ncbi:MSMEG_0568 family radical SAM protein [Thalassolituus maritimus]|uniref:MSMEG_0568 family radical SAM protein n=1 Tax=Thalassolituus maritimus TaxID=484498 RepID=A0ABP9ZWW8_9GAMM